MQVVLSAMASSRAMSRSIGNRMTCPQCNLEMAFAKEVFSNHFHCPRCGTKLFVSETYGRLLMVISIVIGFSLPWVTRLHKLLIPALGPLTGFVAVLALSLPLAFIVLFFVLRVVPRLISPPLVLRRNDPITALNLTGEQGERGSGSHSGS